MNGSFTHATRFQTFIKKREARSRTTHHSGMATYENTDNEPTDTSQNENDKTCCFCNIAKKQSGSDTEMQLFDDELVCFRDMKPGARHHYLVVPRIYVGNCKSLRKEHIPLGRRWSVLQKKKVTDLDDIRMGFHMPPLLLCPSPPSPCHRSCQSDEHQVTQALWATILLVHHCRQSAPAVKDPEPGQIRTHLV